jgi:diaminopimelate dehydrogenase
MDFPGADMRLHLAIIGFGGMGRTCAQAIVKDDRFVLAGIVRRAEHVAVSLPAPFAQVPVVTHIGELSRVDAALICVPTDQVLAVAHDLLQRRIPIVECAALHGEDFQVHKHEIDRMAKLYKMAAVVGAGWDPGALSMFRSLFALLTPKGHTDTTRRPGVSLHHTTVARTIPGVKEALSAELRDTSGRLQHYVYVELAESADFETVERAIHNDPLFVGVETLVFPVESVAKLEEEGHGILLERRGTASGIEHQLFLLEARFSETALAAQVMITATQALSSYRGRACSLQDIPLGALWGEMREWAEKEWI